MKWQQLLSAARNRCVTSTGLIPPSSSLCSSLLRIPAETFARVSEFPDLEENRWCRTPGGVIPHGIMEMLPWGSAQLLNLGIKELHETSVFSSETLYKLFLFFETLLIIVFKISGFFPLHSGVKCFCSLSCTTYFNLGSVSNSGFHLI